MDFLCPRSSFFWAGGRSRKVVGGMGAILVVKGALASKSIVEREVEEWWMDWVGDLEAEGRRV